MTTAPAPALHPGAVIDLDEEARLSALEDLQILDTPPEERFDRLTRLARRLFGVDVALVTLLDRDRQWFKAASGLDGRQVPRDLSFCNTTIREDGTLVVEDLTADDRFSGNPLVTADQGVRFYAGHPLHAPGGQPVGTLCLLDHSPRRFSEAERETLRDLASYVQRELGVREEYEQAAQVQRGLLPRTVPALRGYDVAGACRPARAVGGDFYDWHPVEDGIGFTVADVMGKGFAGAIMMASVRAVLRGAGRSGSAAAALQSAQEVLADDLQETGTFVTLFHGRLAPDDGTIRYVDAGHGLTVVVRADGTFERMVSTGMPLGAWPDSTWDEAQVRLGPGDALVSVSDGVLELYDGTLASLDEVASVICSTGDAGRAVERLLHRARRTELTDDVTVLVVRRRADAGEEGQ